MWNVLHEGREVSLSNNNDYIHFLCCPELIHCCSLSLGHAHTSQLWSIPAMPTWCLSPPCNPRWLRMPTCILFLFDIICPGRHSTVCNGLERAGHHSNNAWTIEGFTSCHDFYLLHSEVVGGEQHLWASRDNEYLQPFQLVQVLHLRRIRGKHHCWEYYPRTTWYSYQIWLERVAGRRAFVHISLLAASQCSQPHQPYQTKAVPLAVHFVHVRLPWNLFPLPWCYRSSVV